MVFVHPADSLDILLFFRPARAPDDLGPAMLTRKKLPDTAESPSSEDSVSTELEDPLPRDADPIRHLLGGEHG